MEKIDILLATYNGEKYIKEQLDSILNQSYFNFNLIISDDKSTDNTAEILKEYAKKDDRIKIYIQEENLGVIKNFEFLLSKVESDYYMLSDQDDIWLKDKISKSYEKLIQENLDLVFSDLEVVDENLNIIHNSMFRFLKIDKRIKKYNDYRLIYLDNCITGCTIISKSKFLNLILPLPDTTKYLVHDYWIALVISLHGKFSYINEPLIKYRQHGNNQIGTDKVSTKFEKFHMVRDLFINVKIERFKVFVENEKIFNNELKKLNKDALIYFEYIKDIKYINFKKLQMFHKIYRDETFSKYILFFVIMNIPIIGKCIFNIRFLILKMISKR
jgi:glycosyltransferase involved in cell wall biosynthesis